MNAPDARSATRVGLGADEAVVGAPLAHDSAHLHVAGEATYTDDIPEPRGTLYAAVGKSPIPHGRIRSLDLDPVRAAPGVVAVIAAADIPGVNDVGPIQHDDPILADGIVLFAGQPVFAVAAATMNAARKAAKRARFDLEPLPAILTIDDAIAAESWVLPPAHIVRGDAAAALSGAPHRLSGRCESGGQDHFYLEGQVSLAVPQEHGGMRLHCSTQHPGEVQQMVARALGLAAHDVVVECRRMGGGFGGKETQMSLFACLAAILARRTGRAVKFRVDRDDDMIMTGKRHAFRYGYDVGFDDDGRILGLDLTFASRCGFSADLSGPINDRAMFHADNCYWLPNVALHSYRCRTNTVSDTAFRGFGGPQGMFAIEYVLDDIAHALGRDPLDVRRVNLYGTAERNVTPYGMTVEDNIAPEIIDCVATTSRYRERRAAIREWNRTQPVIRRGIALTPVKFGISFTATHYNQAGALLHVYNDGTVLLNHGGTEMGQGLFTKVAQVVAQELGIAPARIRVSASDTSKVPNAAPTAASSGSDLNGMAARAAARKLKGRLAAFAAAKLGAAPEEVVFADDEVRGGGKDLAFAELARLAHLARIPMSATGFYATPKIHYDRKTLHGRPFFYFSYGAAVSEVAIDTLDRRIPAPCRRHPAGRRRVAQSGDRPRPGGRRIPAGVWLADDGNAVVERPGPARDAFALHLQDSDRARVARALSRRFLRRAEPRGHDLSLEGGRRAAVDARAVRLPRDPRRRRERGRMRHGATARRAGERRSDLPRGARATRNGSSFRRHNPRRRRRVMTTAWPCPGHSALAWPDALAAALERFPRAVLVTVADARGSTPRESGAAMLVTEGGIAGTIGGGHLEYEAIRLAREALSGTGANATPAATWLVRFPLAARLGQCCGGVATLALQTIERDDAGWLAIARTCLRTQAPFALVATIGSGRAAAARLLVTADDARGTLGEPALESAAVAAARERLTANPGPRSGGTGLVEIGGGTLLVHVVRPIDFHVLVFGNGHVGRALVHVLGALPARVTWVDEREADFPPAPPANVDVVVTDTPDAELRAAAPGTYVLIMTHSHALDFDLALAALARDDWRYVGMIGSKAKRAQFERRVAERGFAADVAARITCPIGATIRGISSKEPGTIAVAVAAELLALRERAVRQDVSVTNDLRSPG